MLPLIKRRLNATERERLKSGNVFVWEEAENDGGLLRWTDGRRWYVGPDILSCSDLSSYVGLKAECVATISFMRRKWKQLRKRRMRRQC